MDALLTQGSTAPNGRVVLVPHRPAVAAKAEWVEAMAGAAAPQGRRAVITAETQDPLQKQAESIDAFSPLEVGAKPTAEPIDALIAASDTGGGEAPSIEATVEPDETASTPHLPCQQQATWAATSVTTSSADLYALGVVPAAAKGPRVPALSRTGADTAPKPPSPRQDAEQMTSTSDREPEQVDTDHPQSAANVVAASQHGPSINRRTGAAILQKSVRAIGSSSSTAAAPATAAAVPAAQPQAIPAIVSNGMPSLAFPCVASEPSRLVTLAGTATAAAAAKATPQPKRQPASTNASDSVTTTATAVPSGTSTSQDQPPAVGTQPRAAGPVPTPKVSESLSRARSGSDAPRSTAQPTPTFALPTLGSPLSVPVAAEAAQPDSRSSSSAAASIPASIARGNKPSAIGRPGISQDASLITPTPTTNSPASNATAAPAALPVTATAAAVSAPAAQTASVSMTASRSFHRVSAAPALPQPTPASASVPQEMPPDAPSPEGLAITAAISPTAQSKVSSAVGALPVEPTTVAPKIARTASSTTMTSAASTPASARSATAANTASLSLSASAATVTSTASTPASVPTTSSSSDLPSIPEATVTNSASTMLAAPLVTVTRTAFTPLSASYSEGTEARRASPTMPVGSSSTIGAIGPGETIIPDAAASRPGAGVETDKQAPSVAVGIVPVSLGTSLSAGPGPKGRGTGTQWATVASTEAANVGTTPASASSEAASVVGSMEVLPRPTGADPAAVAPRLGTSSKAAATGHVADAVTRSGRSTQSVPSVTAIATTTSADAKTTATSSLNLNIIAATQTGALSVATQTGVGASPAASPPPATGAGISTLVATNSSPTATPTPAGTVPTTLDAMAASVVAMYRSGQSSLVLRLDPPGLGAVSVHLALGSNANVNVLFVPTVAQTAHLLQTGLNDLRQAMAASGLTLGQAQIGGGASGGNGGGHSETRQETTSRPAATATASDEMKLNDTGIRGARAIA
jgi:flagellar hook-length control protein FliK